MNNCYLPLSGSFYFNLHFFCFKLQKFQLSNIFNLQRSPVSFQAFPCSSGRIMGTQKTLEEQLGKDARGVFNPGECHLWCHMAVAVPASPVGPSHGTGTELLCGSPEDPGPDTRPWPCCSAAGREKRAQLRDRKWQSCGRKRAELGHKKKKAKVWHKKSSYGRKNGRVIAEKGQN